MSQLVQKILNFITIFLPANNIHNTIMTIGHRRCQYSINIKIMKYNAKLLIETCHF